MMDGFCILFFTVFFSWAMGSIHQVGLYSSLGKYQSIPLFGFFVYIHLGSDE